MTKFLLSALFAFVIAAGLTSCDSTSEPVNNDPKVQTFASKENAIYKYDHYEVDTSDASGNNPDRLVASTKIEVTETIVDTGVSFDGRSNVTIVRSSSSMGTDSVIYSQSANGDLYRYNYGFGYINSYPEVKQFLGLSNDINVKWVLVAKLTDQTGQTWVAAKDSVLLPSFGSYVYLQSDATQKEDTTFFIMGGADAVKCKHVQHKVTAKATISGFPITASNTIDTYISPELGATVWDYIRSSTVSSPVVNGKARGSWKIMTYHP